VSTAAPAAQQALARAALAIDGADPARRGSEHGQRHQAMLGHAVHQARWIGLEQARVMIMAPSRTGDGAVVGDQDDGSLWQRFDAVALHAEVFAVKAPVTSRRRTAVSKRKAEALGRRSSSAHAAARRARTVS
jgi:hypothetical protein